MRKNIITAGILFHLLLFTVQLHAQVGIGTANPDTSTILDIRSSTKGILIPRMTEFQRSKITETADGLLVQDIHSGKTLTNRNNYGQWGVIDPVINQNVNFTAFFTAGAVHVLNYDLSSNHQWTTFNISGPLQGFCSADNIIVFVTQTHVNAIFEDGNKVVQLRSLALSGGSIVDMGATGNINPVAILLKGNTAYRFRLSVGSWSTTTLSSAPANLRVLRDRIIFTAGTSAFYTDGNNLLSQSISGSRAAIYANLDAATIYTTTNLYSFVPLTLGGMDILTNTLATEVTNVFDNGQKNRIVVQSDDRLRVLTYSPGSGGVWSSITITGPVDKVVAADKF
jgi:hypothetical protein